MDEESKRKASAVLAFGDDGPGGVPAFRNGERVLAAFQFAGGYVILCERAALEFVTATTQTGRDGWDNGHYFSFWPANGVVDPDRRAVALARAQAAFLMRCAEWLPDAGRDRLRTGMRAFIGAMRNGCRCGIHVDPDEIYAATFGGLPAAARCYLDPCDCELVHGVQVDSGAGA